MDLVGQPKTKGAWNFQNGQKCICKVPLRNWHKKGLRKRQPLLGQKKSYCDWNFKKPVWFFWPQCVEVRGSVGEVIWSSFLFPSSRVSPALGTPFTLVSGSWLTSFLFCFAQALEMVASCIRQNPNSWVCNCWGALVCISVVVLSGGRGRPSPSLKKREKKKKKEKKNQIKQSRNRTRSELHSRITRKWQTLKVDKICWRERLKERRWRRPPYPLTSALSFALTTCPMWWCECVKTALGPPWVLYWLFKRM